MGSITSANSSLVISIPGVLPAATQLQQFGVDDIFDVDDIEGSETAMGVDGFLTGGYVNVPVKVNLTFMADSPSPPIFDTWYGAQKAQQDTFTCGLILQYPSLGTEFTFTKGFLTRYKPAPDAKKLLVARKFQLTFQSSVPSPL